MHKATPLSSLAEAESSTVVRVDDQPQTALEKIDGWRLVYEGKHLCRYQLPTVDPTLTGLTEEERIAVIHCPRRIGSQLLRAGLFTMAECIH